MVLVLRSARVDNGLCAMLRHLNRSDAMVAMITVMAKLTMAHHAHQVWFAFRVVVVRDVAMASALVE